MQLTFGDAEELGWRKQTRSEIFLAEMEQVVPWDALSDPALEDALRDQERQPVALRHEGTHRR